MPKDIRPEHIAKLITEDPDVSLEAEPDVGNIPAPEDDYWLPPDDFAPMQDSTLPKPDQTLNNVSAAAPMPTSSPPPPETPRKDWLLNKIRRPWSRLQK